MTPIPIVLCGKLEEVAAAFLEGMKPEYEVIHFVFSLEEGVVQIPAMLRGESPTSESALGSKNYAHLPAAIAAGGGYDEDAVAKMMNAAEGLPPIPWLRAGAIRSDSPPIGSAEYGKHMGERAKECLNGLLDGEGKVKGGLPQHKIYFF